MSKIDSPVAGVLMQYAVKVGDAVTEGQEVAVMESMKMEIPILAEVSGTVSKLCCEPGASVAEGATIIELG
jgi:acetyl-CoA carboxylase biotin carboxyl carrier protein